MSDGQQGGAASSMIDAIAAVAHALRLLRPRGMLIGGMAAVVHGVPRLTRDIDVTVAGERLDLDELSELLGRCGILPRIDDAVGFAKEHQVLLMQHRDSGVEIDVTIAWLPFEREALNAAESLTVGGIELPVVRPEDLVVYKLVAWRAQDQQDVQRLLELHGSVMDLRRIRSIVEEFAEVLESPERPAEFDALVLRVLGPRGRVE